MENKDDQFTTLSVRTDQRLVHALYKHSDKKYKGRVNVLTDKIINEYMDIHDGDVLLTDYCGIDISHRYNLQIRYGTYKRLCDMSERYSESKGRIAKIALYIWLLQNI